MKRRGAQKRWLVLIAAFHLSQVHEIQAVNGSPCFWIVDSLLFFLFLEVTLDTSLNVCQDSLTRELENWKRANNALKSINKLSSSALQEKAFIFTAT